MNHEIAGDAEAAAEIAHLERLTVADDLELRAVRHEMQEVRAAISGDDARPVALGLGDIMEVEVLIRICSYLEPKELGRMACVSRIFGSDIKWTVVSVAGGGTGQQCLRSVVEESARRWVLSWRRLQQADDWSLSSSQQHRWVWQKYVCSLSKRRRRRVEAAQRAGTEQPAPPSPQSPRGLNRGLYNTERAQATHTRIMGEAKNGCRRVSRGYGNCYYVTPPLNAYYRRLVHQLAEAQGLEHATVGSVGEVFVDAFTNRQCEDCNTAGGWCLLCAHHAKPGKAVVVAATGKLDEATMEEASAQAAIKAPSEGGSIGRRILRI